MTIYIYIYIYIYIVILKNTHRERERGIKEEKVTGTKWLTKKMTCLNMICMDQDEHRHLS